MSTTTAKQPSKSSKRRKTKSQPVTSGSKPGTPGPSTDANLNLPPDWDDLDTKSNSASDPALAGLDPQPTSSTLSSSGRQSGEPESDSVLNVIGTPVFPSHSKSFTPASLPPPVPAPPPLPATMPKPPETTALAPFSVNEEFIAFSFPDSGEETAAVPIREWDQGKQSGDVEKRGTKRKSGEMSRDDREYDRGGRRERGRGGDRGRGGGPRGDERQRMENVPRFAPWIANVDWDRCTNAPEL